MEKDTGRISLRVEVDFDFDRDITCDDWGDHWTDAADNACDRLAYAAVCSNPDEYKVSMIKGILCLVKDSEEQSYSDKIRFHAYCMLQAAEQADNLNIALEIIDGYREQLMKKMSELVKSHEVG